MGGEEQKRYSWREDLEKFRSMKKPLGVSDLIDAFSTNSMQRKVSSDDPSFPNVESVKNKRRGSLQIQFNPATLSNLTETSATADNVLKAWRRKSTSAILPLRLSEVKAVDIDETGVDAGGKKKMTRLKMVWIIQSMTTTLKRLSVRMIQLKVR